MRSLLAARNRAGGKSGRTRKKAVRMVTWITRQVNN